MRQLHGGRARRVGNRHHHVDIAQAHAARDLVGQVFAHAQARVVHRDAVDQRIGAGKVHVLEDTRHQLRIVGALAAGHAAVEVDEYRLAGLDVAHEGKTAAFQRHGFRGGHPFHAFLGLLAADAQRPDAVGIAKRQHAVARDLRHHGVGALDALVHRGDGAKDRVIVERHAAGGRLQLVRQHIEQHFGIGIGIDVAAVDAVERLAQLAPVGQVAVVGEHDAERRIDVERLRLFLAGAGAGGGIAHLAHAAGARQRAHVAGTEHIAHQAVRLVHVEVVALQRGDARRVLPPVLQQQQAVIEQLVDRPAPNDPDDSTHGEFLVDKA
ncbi:Uncharacterised protein [Bordetella pertussis]|nr:Uncharacterised protein [Bordetella pertussis]